MAIPEHIINEWVETHTGALCDWAYYKLTDEELAKDLVQETFVTACLKYESFEGKSNARTWLFSILNHKIMDHFRKQFRSPTDRLDRDPEYFGDDDRWRDGKKPQVWDADIHVLDNAEFVKVLDGCMGKLPVQWASALQLKYLSGKDGREVCKKLNITTANYWQVIHRAKLQLRQCLELNWFK